MRVRISDIGGLKISRLKINEKKFCEFLTGCYFSPLELNRLIQKIKEYGT